MYKTPQSPTRRRHRSLYPLSFWHPAGRGFSAREIILRSIRDNIPSSSASSYFAADGFISRKYLATLVNVLHSLGAVILVRDTLFLTARFGQEAVPEIFPNRLVFLEVDLYRDFAAPLICNKLDSGRGFILPFSLALRRRAAAWPCPPKCYNIISPISHSARFFACQWQNVAHPAERHGEATQHSISLSPTGAADCDE